jgi:DNA mismatch repair protein MLH1
LQSEDSFAHEQANDMEYQYSEKEPTLCRLKSIKELRADVRDSMHNELTDVFASHTYIGIVDGRRRIVAIQGGVKLYLIDYSMVCNEYFYQLGLTDFGNFGTIRFNPPLDLTELLTTAVAQERELTKTPQAVDWDEVIQAVRNRIIDRREMLAECFSVDISETGKLEGMPLLMKGYMPPLTKLPQFLLRLGPFVNWDEEKACFHSFLRELANFYVPEALPIPPTGNGPDGMELVEDEQIAARRRHLVRSLENVIFPAFKARLVATKGLLTGIVEVANLKGLYRVFERC